MNISTIQRGPRVPYVMGSFGGDVDTTANPEPSFFQKFMAPYTKPMNIALAVGVFFTAKSLKQKGMTSLVMALGTPIALDYFSKK